jgi:hypothetical protein
LRRHEIYAVKRLQFDVDLSELGEEYKYRLRTKKAFFNSRISWIYLHGIELEKRSKETGKWIKHWLCKPCFDDGRVKTMAADST